MISKLLQLEVTEREPEDVKKKHDEKGKHVRVSGCTNVLHSDSSLITSTVAKSE